MQILKEILAMAAMTVVMALAVWGACDIARNISIPETDVNYGVKIEK